ncbi:MAG: hypothetical protein JWP25_8958 [Bradyrhizobium sp.]|nr:hypothetical protein [Bradyrhizobium sp.]
MAFLYLPSSTLSNVTKMTISQWVALPPGPPGGAVHYSFLEFGGIKPNQYSVDSFSMAWIDTGYFGSLTYFQNNFAFGGTGPFGNTPLLVPTLPDPNQVLFGPGTLRWEGQYIIVGSSASTPGAVLAIQAVDSGSSGILTNSNTKYYTSIFVDGSGPYKFNLQVGGSIINRTPPFVSGVVTVQTIPLAAASGTFTFGVWHHVFVAVDIGSSGYMVDNTASSLNGGSKGNKCHLVIDRTNFYGGDSVPGREDFVNTTDGIISNPPVDANPGIAVKGSMIALPFNPLAGSTSQYSINEDLPVNLKRRYSDTQIWLGTYIDPSNIGMFIDGANKPVDPAVPAAAFGEPTMRFRRDRKLGMNFKINQGNSGETFQLAGTAPDFTPGPDV